MDNNDVITDESIVVESDTTGIEIEPLLEKTEIGRAHV